MIFTEEELMFVALCGPGGLFKKEGVELDEKALHKLKHIVEKYHNHYGRNLIDDYNKVLTEEMKEEK